MEVRGQFHNLNSTIGVEALGTHWTRRWVGSITGLDAVAKRKKTHDCCCSRELNPDRPTRSLVSILTIIMIIMIIIIIIVFQGLSLLACSGSELIFLKRTNLFRLWIRTHDPSVRAGEDSTCLRTRGHWDQPLLMIIS
jgi:hypothetical protein